MEVARRSQTCRSKQQRATRCRLAPVVEHYEAPESEDLELHPCVDVTSTSSESRACHDLQKKAKSSMRILSKLRDAYVKLMNDIASGADFTGVASFYGCPATDYSVFMVAKSSRPQAEIQGDKAEHLQLAHPRQFSYIS